MNLSRLSLLFAFVSPAFAADKKPPNILFILAAAQNYKTVGCYPESWPWVKTPNIDALASGVRFQGAYLGADGAASLPHTAYHTL